MFVYKSAQKEGQIIKKTEKLNLYLFIRIEWEGHAHAVAYQYPYILAFDHRFIEIRHVETVSIILVD